MITHEQSDALAELVNIGFGRTAAALSEITGYRVLLDAPAIQVCSMGELTDALCGMSDCDLASVHQVFAGPVAGDALLVLPEPDAAVLARLLAAGDEKPARLSPSDKEVLAEVGNILLNACLGTFGNMLQVRLTFSVARLHVDSLAALLASLNVGAEELVYGLVIKTRFRVRESAISGMLVMILGVSSLDRLLAAVETFG